MKDVNAQALGRKNKGIKKTLTPEQRLMKAEIMREIGRKNKGSKRVRSSK